MLDSFPWSSCHGKVGNMVSEVKSNLRCMETLVDFEQPQSRPAAILTPSSEAPPLNKSH
jgi:hypothetical protein